MNAMVWTLAESAFSNHLRTSISFTFLKLSVMNTAGWEDTVLWSPYGNEGMGYNNFVCVESVKVRFNSSLVIFLANG
jgi:hypothetical protein